MNECMNEFYTGVITKMAAWVSFLCNNMRWNPVPLIVQCRSGFQVPDTASLFCLFSIAQFKCNWRLESECLCASTAEVILKFTFTHMAMRTED